MCVSALRRIHYTHVYSLNFKIKKEKKVTRKVYNDRREEVLYDTLVSQVDVDEDMSWNAIYN